MIDLLATLVDDKHINCLEYNAISLQKAMNRRFSGIQDNYIRIPQNTHAIIC